MTPLIEKAVQEFEEKFGFRAYDEKYTDPEDFLRTTLSHIAEEARKKALEEAIVKVKEWKNEGNDPTETDHTLEYILIALQTLRTNSK
ncbi:MAG: hypothetical protein Q6360_13180 [Candidatus Brocadiales bacterium]|nr:hypothetical protein [Candidatus Brocadiales bacterium]